MQINSKNNLLSFLFIFIGGLLISYNLYVWIITPGWIHNEFSSVVFSRDPSTHENTSGYLLQNIIPSIFDLSVIEQGSYRPRMLAFFFYWLDVNSSYYMFERFPELGLKGLGYAVSIVSIIASIIYFWRTIFPNNYFGLSLIATSSFLYSPIYLNTVGMILRSGKLFACAVGIYAIALFIRYHQNTFILKKVYWNVFIAFVCLIVSTVDEQVIAVLVFLTFLSILFSIKNRKLSAFTVTLGIWIVLYVIYYLYIGRWLFGLYTLGGITEKVHYHKLTDITKIDIEYISNSLEVLYFNVPGIQYVLFFSSCVLAYLYIVKKQINSDGVIISYSLIFFSIFLSAAMLASHPPIYMNKVLWNLFYFPFPVFILFLSTCYLISQLNLKTELKQAVEYILILGLFYNTLVGLVEIKSSYELNCMEFRHTFKSASCNRIPVFQKAP